jgi:hypothetical protein
VQSTRPPPIGQVESWRVPVFPQAALRTLSLMRDPRASLANVVEAASLDPATAGLVMRLGNSALFGSRTRVCTLSQAIGRLVCHLAKSDHSRGPATGVRFPQAARGVAALSASGRSVGTTGLPCRSDRSRRSLSGRIGARCGANCAALDAPLRFGAASRADVWRLSSSICREPAPTNRPCRVGRTDPDGGCRKPWFQGSGNITGRRKPRVRSPICCT